MCKIEYGFKVLAKHSCLHVRQRMLMCTARDALYTSTPLGGMQS
jgi:hypothetical protein